MTFEPIASGRKSAAVAQQLAGTISSGELTPGARLPSEPQLAREFDVSRGVVREAIRMLETVGLLEVRRGYGGGTFVGTPAAEEYQPVSTSVFDVSDVDPSDLAEVERAIEPLSARLAAQRDAARAGGELRRQLARAEAADAYPAQWLSAMADFHIALAELSGNRLLHMLAASLKPAWLTADQRDAWQPATRAEASAALTGVVEAIEAGHGDEAAERMRRFLERQHGR